MKLSTAWFWPCALMGALGCADQAVARGRVALITMLDGDATVIHASEGHAVARFTAAQGAALDAEDIVQTSAKTSLLRLEFDDGSVLDLGPSSRVLLRPVWSSPRDKAATAYLLEGWAKVAVPDKPAPAALTPLATVPLDVMNTGRDVVVRVQGQSFDAFAESGDASLLVRGKDGKATAIKLTHGQYLTPASQGATETLPRPSPGFIQAVPRAFMDTLPTRAAIFKGKEVSLAPAGRLSYAELAPWLNAEPRVRARLAVTWKALAQDEALRGGLISQLALHPEWRRVLYPEPAVVKPASQPTDHKKP